MAFWPRRKSDPKELELLEQRLRQVSKIQLPAKQQAALKRQLFSALEKNKVEAEFLPQSLRALASNITEISQKTMLGIPQQVKMKERLFSFIQKTNWLGLAFGPFRSPRFLKTAVSSALLFFFVITSVFIFPFQVPLSYAARLTYIDDVSGQVFVLRSGKLVPATKDFSLQEGDVLITKDNSYATVRFFDDSVSRLDANTQIEVNRLYSEPFNPVATQIELKLQDGHIWTRVLNLIDENSHFTITTPDAAAIVTKKAAFDLQTHVYTTTLSVFDNVVDFALGKNITVQTRPVLTGFQAQVSQVNGSSVTKIIPVSQGLKNNAADAEWVASNLGKDEVHAQVLVQENQQNLQDKTASMADVLQTTTDLDNIKTLSNPELEQQRLNFVHAYQQLLLGETYVMRQQTGEGLTQVLQFEASVKDIMSRYSAYQKQDPLNANLLFSFIQAKVEEQRKDIATFLPGDPLYAVKQELENTELLLATSDVDKAKMQLSQSEDKLLEVQDLIGKSKFDGAQRVLDLYQHQIDNLVLKVNDDNASELQGKLVSLFEQQIEQIKVLTSIEKMLFVSQLDLLKRIRDLRQQVLEKLMNALEKVNSDVPLSLIQELRDLLQTYMDNGAYDNTFISLLNKIVQKYGKQLPADGNGKLPSQLGVVTIVEDDATPPVEALDGKKSGDVNTDLSGAAAQDPASTVPATQEVLTQQQMSSTQQKDAADVDHKKCTGTEQCLSGTQQKI